MACYTSHVPTGSSGTDKTRGEYAITAIDAFISDSLVFVAPEYGKVRNMWVGSGHAFSAGAGVVVLTAGHNLEDTAAGKPLRLGGRRVPLSLSDVVQSIVLHPTEDIGVMDLKPHAVEALRPWALPISALGTDDSLQVGDAFKLAGFPYEWTQVERLEASHGMAMGLVSVTYGTNLKDPPRDDRGRLRIDWSERVVESGESVRMPHPGGISGGGLWRLLQAPKDVLWRADACAKLIGVPVSWNKVDTSFVVPISKWGPWLSNVLSASDTLE